MSDLIAFVRRCLDDEERVARAATAGPWRRAGAGEWGDEEAVLAPGDGRPICVAAAGDFGDPQSASDTEHITRHDPARALTEVAAKRAILDAAEAAARQADADNDRALAHIAETYNAVVSLLAQPYAGRDGWREEWRA